MHIVIFGPQGAGKGTQSARISEKFGIPSIATGDIFRWAIRSETELGKKVAEYVEGGTLVPDELTISVVQERLEKEPNGWILDGFPRNTGQADALGAFLAAKGEQVDAALMIEVPEEVSLRRITARRICSNCGKLYSLANPPSVDWTCDNCGGEVIERQDDSQKESVLQRLRTYHELTEPLKAYYAERGLLREINGEGSTDEVFARILAAL